MKQPWLPKNPLPKATLDKIWKRMSPEQQEFYRHILELAKPHEKVRGQAATVAVGKVLDATRKGVIEWKDGAKLWGGRYKRKSTSTPALKKADSSSSPTTQKGARSWFDSV